MKNKTNNVLELLSNERFQIERFILLGLNHNNFDQTQMNQSQKMKAKNDSKIDSQDHHQLKKNQKESIEYFPPFVGSPSRH